MARKTRKIRKSRGGVSLFGKKRPTRKNSSKESSSVQKRKKKLEKFMNARKIDALKQDKCLAQYQRCMGVSRRRSH